MQSRSLQQPVVEQLSVAHLVSSLDEQWRRLGYTVSAESERVAQATSPAGHDFEFGKLPVELQQQILEHMDFRTGYNLTQTCKGVWKADLCCSIQYVST